MAGNVKSAKTESETIEKEKREIKKWRNKVKVDQEKSRRSTGGKCSV